MLGRRYRLERLLTASPERVLFVAYDTLIERHVGVRMNFFTSDALRAWVIREAQALGQLDHPAIRHVYDLILTDDIACRIGNWVEGESLHESVARGPRLIPTVLTLARDLLGAVEHAHTHGIIVRRLVPAALVLNAAGRGVVTDLRFCSWTLPAIPPDQSPSGLAFMAPEVRGGATGDQASDVYAVGAILYYAVTGQEPTLDPRDLIRPADLRPACPRAVDRIVRRALSREPEDRYLTASEMLEDFVADAGTFEGPAVSVGGVPPVEDTPRWEQRLRRALGDDYELLGQLGSGGFGRVYRVRDLHLERQVALKVLHPLLTRDAEVVERFRREAQLAARLSHPNIVDIYDIAGRSGLLWYTMELVDGPSLGQLVEREGPLDVERVMRLLRESLSALAHAHAQGLVHRDIKPENMLIERDGSVRITDFGLALALRGQKFGGATSQSGTPQFASPEQLLGERVDQRTDLYSLAAVAAYALLGYPPFPGLTPEQVLARQTTDQMPSLVEARPDVSEALANALLRALHNDVGLRYPSAAEFLQAVNRATGSGLGGRGSEWARAAVRWLKLDAP
jgi:serine/threonine protein kinase